MKKSKNDLGLPMLASVITALVIFFVASPKSIAPSDWSAYESENGFSFAHPEYIVPHESTKNGESTVVLSQVIGEVDGEPDYGVPAGVVQVSEGRVSFALWEGIPWDGFEVLVESFEFTD